MSLHFIRPEWLWALLPLAGLLLLLWRNQDANTAWSRYIAPHLANMLMDSGKQGSRASLLMVSLIWFIGVFALSGPAVTKETLPVFASTQGRVIVMDMSLSMYATDLAPNRLSQAKFKAIDLLKELKEGETGLIAYAGDAFTISPLTRDSATLQNLLPTLTPDIMPVLGSDAASGLTQAVTLLKNGGHLNGDIILITDGINSNQLNDAKKALAGENYRLAIMGFGTQQGAAIRLPSGQLLRDNADQVVVAKTDYDILRKLANEYHGVVTRNSVDDSDVKRISHWLSKELSAKNAAKITDQQGETWLDLGPYLSLLLLPLLLLSFRKGFSIAALFLVFNIFPKPAEAALWEDLWKTQNQQAQQAYQEKEYKRAAEQFNHPQWHASADYKAGDYQQALEGFEQDSSANGLYNQGNSLMQLNKPKEAQKRYQQAIDKDPDFADAKHNLDLAKQLDQQQKQNQSGNGEDNKDNKDKNEDNQDQDKKDQQDKQGKQDQQKNEDSNKQDDQGEQSEADKKNQDQQNKPESQPEPQPDSQSEQEKNKQAEQQPKPQSDEEKKAEQQDAKAAETEEQENQNDPQSEQQSTQAKPIDPSVLPEDLPPEMQRVLNAIQDDPQLLLRNKMQLEYQKRRQKGRLLKEKEQW